LPGGGIEINEAPEAAAIREVKEETGLNIISMQKIGSFLNTRKGETHVFYSTHFEGAVSPTVRFEIMECKWFPLQHLPQEFFDVDRGHVENYLKIVNSSN
jgi:8-oxo-dGTP diphosphatase